MNNRLWVFAGAPEGKFRIERITPIVGETLPGAPRLHVSQQPGISGAAFELCGVTSNERYVTRPEKVELVERQEAIGRSVAPFGALILIKKSHAWWDLTQDERRAIIEDKSSHIRIGKKALPQVARRLHHCRDLATAEPFDFLTWFDFRAEDAGVFDDLLGALRATEEWSYVEREVEVRVVRE